MRLKKIAEIMHLKKRPLDPLKICFKPPPPPSAPLYENKSQDFCAP